VDRDPRSKRRVIVATASYHMPPRSLLELHAVKPEIEFISYPFSRRHPAR
jgi:uncharacterized SAM-binding protein YcdF (DUF218 family)